MDEIQQSSISGFWRRFAAFILDCLVLGAFGSVLGLFLKDQFVQLGAWGRLLGFCIALLYFGILNSKISKGQTIGKRLLRIRVVDKKGGYISVERSFIRYGILGLPFFLNNAHFPYHVLMSFMAYPLAFAVFGIGISIVYLAIFNRVTRQSLHDLITGTYVVRQDEDIAHGDPIWKVHYGIVGTLMAASLITPYFTSRIAQESPFDNMLRAVSAITENHDFSHVDVHEGKSFTKTTNEGNSEATYLSMRVFLKTDDVANESIAGDVARTVLATHSEAYNKDIIQVVLIFGYDIGIASIWRSQVHAYSPQEWLSLGQEK